MFDEIREEAAEPRLGVKDYNFVGNSIIVEVERVDPENYPRDISNEKEDTLFSDFIVQRGNTCSKYNIEKLYPRMTSIKSLRQYTTVDDQQRLCSLLSLVDYLVYYYYYYGRMCLSPKRR